jgi:hypothetical protein
MMWGPDVPPRSMGRHGCQEEYPCWGSIILVPCPPLGSKDKFHVALLKDQITNHEGCKQMFNAYSQGRVVRLLSKDELSQ